MEEKQVIVKEILDALKGQLPEVIGQQLKENSISKQDIEKMFSEKTISKSEFQALQDSMTAISETMKNSTLEKEKKKTLLDGLKEKVAEIIEKADRRELGFVKVGKINKAAGNMLESTNITTTNGIFPAPMFEPSINDLPKNVFVVRQYADVGITTSPIIIYAEKKNRDGVAAKQTEGSRKSQIDFDIVTNNAVVSTYADWVKISKQMLNDVDFINSEVRSELLYQLALLEESTLITYLGTIAGSLDLSALADTFGLNKSNMWDALSAAITQIRINMGQKATPNIIALNPVDVYKLQVTKNSSLDYIAPIWASPTGLQVRGVPIVECDGITAGSFLVGDLKKLHIRDAESISISEGFDSDDFTKNLVTILGENRFAHYVKSNDYESIVMDTFANAKTFLEAGS
ncbi:MAG TPA: phage major capsid protein [Candidatus Kapabacteria bacterium]|nr:phage major capsid protein [Candidatus Kapabacteria bacterium]